MQTNQQRNLSDQQRIAMNMPPSSSFVPSSLASLATRLNDAPSQPVRKIEKQSALMHQGYNHEVIPITLPSDSSRNVPQSVSSNAQNVRQTKTSFVVPKNTPMIGQINSPPGMRANGLMPTNYNSSLLNARNTQLRTSAGVADGHSRQKNNPFSVIAPGTVSSLSQKNSNILDDNSNNGRREVLSFPPMNQASALSSQPTKQTNNNNTNSQTNSFNPTFNSPSFQQKSTPICSNQNQNKPPFYPIQTAVPQFRNNLQNDSQTTNERTTKNGIFAQQKPRLSAQVQPTSQTFNVPQSQYLQRTQNPTEPIVYTPHQQKYPIERINNIQLVPTLQDNQQRLEGLGSRNSNHIIDYDTAFTQKLEREKTRIDNERRQDEEVMSRRMENEQRTAAEADQLERNRMKNYVVLRNPTIRRWTSQRDDEENIEEMKEESVEPLQIIEQLELIRSDASSSCESDSDEETKENNEQNVPLIQIPRRNVIVNQTPTEESRRLSGNNNQINQTTLQRLPGSLDVISSRDDIPHSDSQEIPQIAEHNSGRLQTIRQSIPQRRLMNGIDRDLRSIDENLLDLVAILSNRLGNISGPINNQHIEDLAQMLATLRLFQTIPRGLSKNQIQDFPLIQLKQVDKDEICSICLEKWEINDEAKILGCMHKFHQDCIVSWLKEQTICPNCKQDQLEFFSDKIPSSLQQDS